MMQTWFNPQVVSRYKAYPLWLHQFFGKRFQILMQQFALLFTTDRFFKLSKLSLE